ncbi:MAG: helix-turn-helix domain-containing protein [Clostridiales bacterium]|nr:helix-turn-helix domain-containing protein [Clostridiales bacterium]
MSQYPRERQHGTSAFPLAVYPIVYTGANETMFYSHLHAEWEFFLVTSGEAALYVNSNRYSLRPGDCLLITSDALHYAKSVNHKECKTIALLCHPDFLRCGREEDIVAVRYLQPLMGHGPSSAIYLPADTLSSGKVIHLMEEVARMLEGNAPGRELLVKARMLELMYYFFSQPNAAAPIPNEEAEIIAVKNALVYLQDHYPQDLTLDELAQQAHMSPGQFGRLFKRVMGQTPMTYLVQHRITCAARILAETNMKISDICLKVGFHNFSYFNRCFRQYLSTTPGEYRKAAKEHQEYYPPGHFTCI